MSIHVVELKALPQRLHTYFLAVPLYTFLYCMSAASVVYVFGHSSHYTLSPCGVCLGPNLSFFPRQVGICFCWLCLLQNVPSHLGHPKMGVQAMVLLHIPPDHVLLVIPKWVAINWACVKSALVQVPPIVLGPVVYVNGMFVIAFGLFITLKTCLHLSSVLFLMCLKFIW